MSKVREAAPFDKTCYIGGGVTAGIGAMINTAKIETGSHAAPAGAEIAARLFQRITGRVWRGTALGGARGRTDAPKIVDWHMEKKIEIDPMIPARWVWPTSTGASI